MTGPLEERGPSVEEPEFEEATPEGMSENPVTPEQLLGVLEAVLFAAEEPLNEAAIALSIPGVLESGVESLVEQLEAGYRQNGRGLTVQRVAGGWRLATRAEFAEYVRNHLRGRLRNRLSRAALETVSIIAYRQPLSRSEIELMRGVDCSPVLRNLLERNLIRIAGRAEVPGRPLLYGTTDAFLAYFGLESLTNLPKAEEILGEPVEGTVNPELPVQRGPFAGRDSGVELETYRITGVARQHAESEDEPETSIWNAELPEDEEGQGGGAVE